MVIGLNSTTLLYPPTIWKPAIAALKWTNTGFVAPETIEVTDYQEKFEIELKYKSHKRPFICFEDLAKSLENAVPKKGSALLQVGLYDFDGDGIEELVFAFRWAHETVVKVYHYSPPYLEQDANASNWKCILSESGPSYPSVREKSVFFSDGSYGNIEYRWIGDRFSEALHG